MHAISGASALPEWFRRAVITPIDMDTIVVKLLGPADGSLFENVAPDTFDNPVAPRLVREFLDDPRHHIVAALDGDRIVGMATAVHYVHPDKAAQLFINEVGVAESYHRMGIGGRLMDALLRHGRALGCTEAWVATEPDNTAARALYARAGGVEDSTPFVMYNFRLDTPP